MSDLPQASNDNGKIILPHFTCGELASVITCVLSAKARQEGLSDPDFTPAFNKLITAFMEQAQ